MIPSRMSENNVHAIVKKRSSASAAFRTFDILTVIYFLVMYM